FTSGQLSTAYYGKPGACTAEDVSKDWYTHYAAPSLPAPIEATEFAPIAKGNREATGLAYGKPGSRLHLTQGVTTGDEGFALRSPYIAPSHTAQSPASYPSIIAPTTS